MSNEITMSPALAIVDGKTATDRKMSIATTASGGALMALATKGGAVGKHVRFKAAQMGLESITRSASNAQYGPLAEYLAASLGESFVISNRSSFESLPDQMEQRILKIKGTKSGGYREDKSGLSVPNAALSLAMTLKAECGDIIGKAQAIRSAREAARVTTPMVTA